MPSAIFNKIVFILSMMFLICILLYYSSREIATYSLILTVVLYTIFGFFSYRQIFYLMQSY